MGVTHSHETLLTGAGEESCASVLAQWLAQLGSAPIELRPATFPIPGACDPDIWLGFFEGL